MLPPPHPLDHNYRAEVMGEPAFIMTRSLAVIVLAPARRRERDFYTARSPSKSPPTWRFGRTCTERAGGRSGDLWTRRADNGQDWSDHRYFNQRVCRSLDTLTGHRPSKIWGTVIGGVRPTTCWPATKREGSRRTSPSCRTYCVDTGEIARRMPARNIPRGVRSQALLDETTP